MSRWADPADDSESREVVISFLGVSFSMRNGYSLYALQVTPPPQGFSHASFSSIRMVLTPALARRAAATDPAGPPPSTATVLIILPPEDVQEAMPDCRSAALAQTRMATRRRADSCRNPAYPSLPTCRLFGPVHKT